MATTKKPAGAADNKTKSGSSHHQRYEQTLQEFGAAVESLQKGEYDDALKAFRRIEATELDEPALLERARSYARICETRLSPPGEDPQGGDDKYHQGVISMNKGNFDRALSLFESALNDMPESPKVLYARASAWSLKGNAEAAVADLRRAIDADPHVRFHAANDPDFEPIREEPAFIDIIEPTPTGS